MSTLAAARPAHGAQRISEDPRELFLSWQQNQDRVAHRALVERFMPLTRSLARRYGRSSEPFEDLLQVASLGLLKALDRYDVDRGHAFESFAVPTILGEMRRYFRDCGWSVHMPRSLQEQALAVRDAQEQITNELGRAPSANQLAEYLELDMEIVLEALQAVQAYESVSLEAPRPGSEEDGATYAEALGGDDDRFELVELDATVSSVLGEMSLRERRVLYMRFVEDLTQSEIGDRVGISQMQVSRVLRGALEKLRSLTCAQEER